MKRARAAAVAELVIPPPVPAAPDPEPTLTFDFRRDERHRPAVRREDASIKATILRWLDQRL